MNEALAMNGVHGRTGQYLLHLEPQELEQVILAEAPPGKRARRFSKKHLEVLRERNRLAQEDRYLLEYGRSEDNLAEAGWAVVFPWMPDMKPVHAVREALSELLEWRKAQAGELYKECLGGERGVLPKDTADRFMKFYKSSPGVVTPRPDTLPYYLLLVGSPEQIPFRFQYELDTTYLVGRIYFDTLDEYARYAHSVVAAEKQALNLARRAVFFGSAHPGDSATQKSARLLVKNLAQTLQERRADWQVEALPPEECRKARLEELLGKKDAPALLFTATHGLGFDANDPEQEKLQGGLVCQDLEMLGIPPGRETYLAGEDIASDFKLHGLVAFHFACYGAGTPLKDNFARPGAKPEILARREFLADLPRRLLAHPQGGALAVIGHVDRAWTYSFEWGEAGEQTGTFANALNKLMAGKPVGAALDDFNVRYAQVAVRLNTLLNKIEVVQPDFSELAGLWTANNDARSYVLLGDPAVRLPVAPKDGKAKKHQVLAPLTVAPAAGGAGRVEQGQAGSAGAGQTGAGESATTPAGANGGANSDAERMEPWQAAAAGAAFDPANPGTAAFAAGGPVTIQVTPQGVVTIVVNPAGARDISGAQDFGNLWGQYQGEEAQAESGKPGPFAEIAEKLKRAAAALAEKVENAAEDITTLEVRTYVSEQIDKVELKDGHPSLSEPRALTVVKLDGDTDVVVPLDAGQVDEQLWEIHSRTVEQAQAYRTALFKAMGEWLSGFIPKG